MGNTIAALVVSGNGTNCERETAHACRLGGFTQVDIHSIWEIVAGDVSFAPYHFLCLPGGFLDGDDLGSAKAQANRLLHSVDAKTNTAIIEQILAFIAAGKIILGICNGFQLMVKLGLLPASSGNYTEQLVTLCGNDSGKFEDRWVELSVNENSPCIFTRGISSMYLPVRHGEGKFIAKDKNVLDSLMKSNLHVIQYLDQQTHKPTLTYPDNPNGAQHGIAGICDTTGRLFGLMPHPEACVHRTHHPRWTREDLPEEGDGLAIFKNAFTYAQEKFS